MNAVEVLLADLSEEDRSGVLACVKNYPNLAAGHCVTCREVLDRTEPVSADAVILSLDRIEDGGIDFLRFVRKQHPRPYVVVITSLTHPGMLRLMRGNSAGFIFNKTAPGFHYGQPLELIRRASGYFTDELLSAPNLGREVFFDAPSNSADGLEKRLYRDLAEMGFRTELKGYRYLVDCILMVLQTDRHLMITRDIYPSVAEKNQCHPFHVERAVRHAVQYTWDHTREDQRRIYCHIPTDPNRGYPSNGTFIYDFAQLYR